MMIIDSILSRLDKVRPGRKDGVYMAVCPAHDDNSPSLAVFDHGDKCGLHCHAGCDYTEVLDAIGLKASDLYEKVENEDEWKIKQAEIRRKKARDRDMSKLYGELSIITQCIESRMYSKEPQIEGRWDAYEREKLAARMIPKLLEDYYK